MSGFNVGENRSYAEFGFMRSVRQLRHAWKERKRADNNMLTVLEALRGHEERMERKLGQPIENLQILEVGPGQGMERARYFGLRNKVTGMDLDVIPHGFDPAGYLRVLRRNGLGRLLKTVGRQVIIGGVNSVAWSRAVGNSRMKTPPIIHGDICEKCPEVGAYDVVMSWSVFEHLSDPVAALDNVISALRPGGILYISLHLYTSNNGHHDIRAFTGDEKTLPVWGHLRPSTQHLIEPSSYLNRWRLYQWRELFAERAPGSDEVLVAHDHRERFGPFLTGHVRRELADYSEEELFTVDVVYLWQKPSKKENEKC